MIYRKSIILGILFHTIGKRLYNNLNSKNIKIIGIIFVLQLKFQAFLIQYQNPERYAEFCANHMTKRNFMLVENFLRITKS